MNTFALFLHLLGHTRKIRVLTSGCTVRVLGTGIFRRCHVQEKRGAGLIVPEQKAVLASLGTGVAQVAPRSLISSTPPIQRRWLLRK